jgi:nucleotide-binding universal stress UspA family protein
MSILPTKILLATDGSEDAARAAEVAVELSKVSGSELHLVFVGKDAYSEAMAYPEPTSPAWVGQKDPVLI